MSQTTGFEKEFSDAQEEDYPRFQSWSARSDGAEEPEPPALEITDCPECGARRFVSKLLVYEETTYDEDGEQASRRHHVRTEFEFTCGECQTILRTLPAERRDYYEDVQVLAAERRAALRAEVRALCGRVARRFWVPTPQLALVLTVLVGIVLIGLRIV